MYRFLLKESSDEVLLTIPTYATNDQIKAYMDACKIAEVNARLIDESTAIVHSYAKYNMSSLQDGDFGKKIVIFVDIGHSDTSITVA